MTYNVFGGTLNLILSIYHYRNIPTNVLIGDTVAKTLWRYFT